ncbi:MAG: NAD(P)H-dependent oxidoreductase [Pseudomonadota bacterium]
MTIQLLALSGSARSASHNLKLVKAMADGATAVGAQVTVIDWSQFVLPVFNEDIEHQLPAAAVTLKNLFVQSQGLLIAEPEYNGGYSALMKNAIDWVSRPLPGALPGSPFKNKVVVIAGATTGKWGAVRSVRQLREVMGYLGCIVLPDTLSVNEAGKAFDAEGRLLDAKTAELAAAAGAAAARAAAALAR